MGPILLLTTFFVFFILQEVGLRQQSCKKALYFEVMLICTDLRLVTLERLIQI